MKQELTRRALLVGTAGAALVPSTAAFAQSSRRALVATPALTPVPLAAAFERAANAVLSSAAIRPGQKAEIAIDPLVDGRSGAQTAATRTLGTRLAKLISERYTDRFTVVPFTREALARKPLVFIGTFTAVASDARPASLKDSYRLWFSMLNLNSQTIVAKAQTRATLAGVDTKPTPAFAEAPAWVRDIAVSGYIDTCQTTKVGDAIKPAYARRLDAAAVVGEAIAAYDANKFETALEHYTRARSAIGGDQLRVLNGLYLSNRKLNREEPARQAFRELVDFGLQNKRMSLLLLFQPGTTTFIPGSVSRDYPFWLRTVAERAKAGGYCLRLIGHASRTGTEAFNEQLSLDRAVAIRTLLAAQARDIAGHLATTGVSWRENIIGTGRDDETDALDRRVEFQVVGC